jgi:endo-1,4-beta-xylanase
MRMHNRKEAGHYRDSVPVWDVVNEVVADSGRLRPSVFLRRLGPDYIAEAFRLAHRTAPKAKLYINEIGADGLNQKSDRLYRLVRELRSAGVPLDGVGLQGHFNLKGIPDGYRQNMERFAALGLEVAITELDVALPAQASAEDERRQADIYAEVVRTCKAVPACRSITFWGFTDSRSWISETQPGFGAATLLDARLRPKPAFEAVQRALSG